MRYSLLIAFFTLLLSCNSIDHSDKNGIKMDFQSFIDTNDLTNDFFDNVETHDLPVKLVSIEGEIKNPGRVDFSVIPLHSIIVKETVIDGDTNSFVGAYKYEGYSLKDILNRSGINKVNKEVFDPNLDLYVVISNSSGEKVVFSWGEIFYPVHQHEILLATRVMHIVPSKSMDLWPLPNKAKIVAAADLLTERNLIDPDKITVRSLKREFAVKHEIEPLYSDHIEIFINDSMVGMLNKFPAELNELTYPTTFYGRGRGIHGISPFRGILLKEVLSQHTQISNESITQGIITITAIDGYRVAFSFSEVFNRNDQAELLLVNRQDDLKGGRFSIFPAADFFSDRAIKAINGIYIDIIEE